MEEEMEEQLLSNKAADVFLNHGGLGYFPSRDLLPTFGPVSREFKKHARAVFAERLRRTHPSLVLAVESSGGDVGSITWRDWCRFERKEGSNIGDRWNVQLSDFYVADIDVLLEVTKSDGRVVWHGCEPLHRSDHPDWSDEDEAWRTIRDCPECEFKVPHFTLDALRPREGDVYGEPDRYYPELWHSYYYWSGRSDCSLQQKTLCKALYGINTPKMLQVHVVLRRRSTGQMATVLSSSKPNQIIGEDYGEPVGSYTPLYDNSTVLFLDDNRVGTELQFDMYCPVGIQPGRDTIEFTTNDDDDDDDDGGDGDNGDDCAIARFQFDICDGEPGEGEDLVLRTLRALKWA